MKKRIINTLVILFASIFLFVNCGKKKIEGSNIVGDWYHEISQNMGGYQISLKNKIEYCAKWTW
jgi:hypothetical protein